jgi:SAM-dependent methyltransferase
MEFDPASFKDPAGRVFHHQDSVCRTLSDQAHRDFQAASAAGLIDALVRDQLLVSTEVVSTSSLGLSTADAGAFVLKQPRIPVVTYPYEWSFEMLRDAALVTLRTIDRALAAGFILKDATSFNILFDGNVPKLVDAPSIEPYRDGGLWAGYGQFCRCFLFPLLVAAYREIDLQALLRGAFGELPAQEAAKLLRLRDYPKPGVLKDVVLQSRLDRSYARSGSAVKSATSGQRYPKALLVANVRRLTKVVEQLEAPSLTGEWSRYDTFHTYTESDRSSKSAFVESAVAGYRGSRVVDLGCNTGEYSRIALRGAASVIGIDIDSGAIDRLYRGLSGPAPLSPIVASLLSPTPAMGWGLRERRSLFDRIGSDAFLALALIHHLRITGGVPLAAIVAQLFAIAPEGVVEWVDKDDEMVRAMLSLRPDVYDDYTWPAFEAALREHGEIVAEQPTHGGRRRLCQVRRRA